MRILVVEDEKSISDFLKRNLEAEGFIVDAVNDGEKGSYFACTNNYDLIILDNMLPKKPGLEICKDARDNGIETPILMLSAMLETGIKITLLNAGADDYLTKPFSLNELLARVNALLRRPRHIENIILQVDDLMLDSNTRIVKRGKKDITLTQKEFIFLEYLMKNENKALSRGMIMEHVWDMNADLFSNTIEAHILTLRNKIEKKRSKKLIHTIPKVGYKICG